MSLRAAHAATVALALGLAGCASYQPLPLSHQGKLAPNLAGLQLTLPPDEAGKPPVTLNATQPLTPQQVGLLAVRNNPDLADQRAKLDSAEADLLSARLLPNPSVTASYAFLAGGPDTEDAKFASISQDIQSIVTYGPRVAAAKARYKQVSASALWDVWQVAQKGRMLAVSIYGDQQEIRLREQELSLLVDQLKKVRAATVAGNLDLTAEAPLLAAEAGAQRDLTTAQLALLKDWQDLDALLGLKPSARFAITAPEPVKLPDKIEPLIASLPQRRPDLVALRLGYDAAEADVRQAILGQFPAFSLGVAGGSDTTATSSLGPQITFDLPIFNRNQGKIASTRATRLQLHEEYRARLDEAEGTARSLLAHALVVEENLASAKEAATGAASRSQAAQRAYQQGNLSQRDIADYMTTALDRQLDALGYERQLQQDSLALSVELGLGLPQTLPVAPTQETNL